MELTLSGVERGDRTDGETSHLTNLAEALPLFLGETSAGDAVFSTGFGTCGVDDTCVTCNCAANTDEGGGIGAGANLGVGTCWLNARVDTALGVETAPPSLGFGVFLGEKMYFSFTFVTSSTSWLLYLSNSCGMSFTFAGLNF